MLLEQCMQIFAGRAVLIQHEDWILQQFLIGHFPAAQFLESFICNKYILKFMYGCGREHRVQMTVRKIHYNQIDLPAPQKFHTADGSSIGNFDMRPRKSLVKLFQIRNEEIPADRIACADAELTDSGGGFQ